jgi:hypothetical protein
MATPAMSAMIRRRKLYGAWRGGRACARALGGGGGGGQWGGCKHKADTHVVGGGALLQRQRPNATHSTTSVLQAG